ncbi:glycosyltransferase family 2 protein [Ascidiimonas sp. W6]|uniref:glycosyltransferase family 2 protein n=1 Tax=Ascidiimonas meishanensis TaxID=3128903 RepID=UPI0030EDE73E
MSKNVFIVIVTYNGMRWLDKVLNSICPEESIIIIDNNSTDNTVDFIKTNFPKVNILQNLENKGFGQANNQGIEIAIKKGAEYVFLLNQDAWVNNNTIPELIKAAEKNPEFGIYSPVHCNGTNDALDRSFSNYLRYDRNRTFIFDAIMNKLKPVYEVTFINAAAWFLPVSSFKKIGGFDPIFFHYGEDDNYCQRVLFHNLKIGVVPKAFIWHDREGVKRKEPKLFDDSYFKVKETKFKIKYADIDSPKNASVYLKILRNTVIKAILKLKFKEAREFYKEYQFTLKWNKESNESMNINKKEGNHYLDL